MGVPPPLAELRDGVGLSAAIFFAICPPAEPRAAKKDFRYKVASKRGQRTRLRGLCRA
ncbi:MAG: hypothetical protein LBQ31_11730 [Bacteroidales bacterium]|nr:hypothetical protein [Bacteroidales bacterium]